jgi:hypothetical protein
MFSGISIGLRPGGKPYRLYSSMRSPHESRCTMGNFRLIPEALLLEALQLVYQAMLTA